MGFLLFHHLNLQNIAVCWEDCCLKLITICTRQGDITEGFFSPNRQTEHFVSKLGFLEISRDLAGLFLAGRELKWKWVQRNQQVWLLFDPCYLWEFVEIDILALLWIMITDSMVFFYLLPKNNLTPQELLRSLNLNYDKSVKSYFERKLWISCNQNLAPAAISWLLQQCYGSCSHILSSVTTYWHLELYI